MWATDYFGDLLIPAIACGLKKTVLIFNVDLDSLRDPVTVVNPEMYGVENSSKYPIVIAWGKDHYESIHPAAYEDELKCIELVRSVAAGSYVHNYKDLKRLTDISQLAQVDNTKTIEKTTSATKQIQDKGLKRPLEANSKELAVKKIHGPIFGNELFSYIELSYIFSSLLKDSASLLFYFQVF